MQRKSECFAFDVLYCTEFVTHISRHDQNPSLTFKYLFFVLLKRLVFDQAVQICYICSNGIVYSITSIDHFECNYLARNFPK